MQQELDTNPDHPDTKKLNSFFATAAGVRTEAFKEQPPYVQALINKLESDKLLMTLNATTLAQYPNNIAYGHFKVEIERSQKFIAMLKRELKNVQAQLNKNAANAEGQSAILGTWKYVDGDYEIEVTGSNGSLQGMIKKGPTPRAGCPWDYKVGTTMFDHGTQQPDGTWKVYWAQYTWETPSLKKLLGRSNTLATIKLDPDKESFVVIGNKRKYESMVGHETWLREFGSQFKFSFIKIDSPSGDN